MKSTVSPAVCKQTKLDAVTHSNPKPTQAEGKANIHDRELQVALHFCRNYSSILSVMIDEFQSDAKQAIMDRLLSDDAKMKGLESGARGSKIGVTTRNKNIMTALQNVSPYQLQRMSVEDCWSLFSERDAKQAIMDRLLSDDAKMKGLESGARGSKIGVTTRNKNIMTALQNVSPYQLQRMSVEDCWSLFSEYAFSGENCNARSLRDAKQAIMDRLLSDDAKMKGLESGARGSKIGVTTRNKNIMTVLQNVSPYQLQRMSVEDCWSLFPERDAKQAIMDRLLSDDAKMKGLESGARGIRSGRDAKQAIMDRLLSDDAKMKGLESGARGSKIGVTTRNKNIMTALQNVSPYQLQRMSVEDCWSLFSEYAFSGENCNARSLRDAKQAIMDRLLSDDAKMKGLESGARGSKIGVTTRNKNIMTALQNVSPYQLQRMSVEDYWSLFSEYAFSGENCNARSLRDAKQAIMDRLLSDDAKMKDLESGARGSKIGVTTRNKNIMTALQNVSPYQLQRMSVEDCWSLFSERDAKQAIMDRLLSDDAKMKGLESGARGSKIGVTTRNKNIMTALQNVSPYQLQRMSVEDCWSLFSEYAFSGENCNARSLRDAKQAIMDRLLSDDAKMKGLESGARGSKIGVTTRNKNIMTALQNVSPYQLQRMSVEDCWSLFSEYAFSGENCNARSLRDAKQAIMDRLLSDDAKMKGLESGARGSKIGVTTRNKNIMTALQNVSPYQLQRMSVEDCWSLFSEYAFSGENCNARSLRDAKQAIMDRLLSDDAKMKGLESGARGSKIGVTTRNKNIMTALQNVSPYQLQRMSVEDCWSLFSEYAFSGENCNARSLRDAKQAIMDRLLSDDAKMKGLESGARGSKIGVTTRNKNIMTALQNVSPYQLQRMSVEDYWSLFSEYAFSGENCNARSLLDDDDNGLRDISWRTRDVSFAVTRYEGLKSVRGINEVQNLLTFMSMSLRGWSNGGFNSENRIARHATTDRHTEKAPIVDYFFVDASDSNLGCKRNLNALSLVWSADTEVKLVKLSFGYSLKLFSFQALHSLSKEMGKLGCDSTTLLSIDIVGVTIKWLPLMLFPRLKQLSIWTCLNLESLCVQEEPCSNFESTSSSLICQSPHLEKLSLHNCPKLKSFHCFLPSLVNLKIYHYDGIKSFPRVGLSPKLESLKIQGCNKLLTSRKQWNLQRFPSLSRFCFGAPTLNPHLSWNP
ncbi:hypothetical protein DKX38_027505 [Salix brachista]|uniref:Uncharacterized protein n=1 Tax=Salix brachista TaxID=2182728 RepID=A0A5N5JP03_9ROSI|nr:hypothetical protein DKX38_027505 [Salix brachista]